MFRLGFQRRGKRLTRVVSGAKRLEPPGPSVIGLIRAKSPEREHFFASDFLHPRLRNVGGETNAYNFSSRCPCSTPRILRKSQELEPGSR